MLLRNRCGMLRKAFAIMRGCVSFSVALAPLCATPAAAGCGSSTLKSPPGDAKIATHGSLDWVKISRPIYIAMLFRGVFQLNLNSLTAQPLGIHKGALFDDFHMSPSGRYLIYQLSGSEWQPTYIYDLHLGIEQRIPGIPTHTSIIVSPNDKWLATISTFAVAPVVWLLKLKDGKVQRYPLPSNDEDNSVVSTVWSAENNLLLDVRKDAAEAFWSFNPETGKFLQVRGVRTSPTNIAYFTGSKEIQTVCEWCTAEHRLTTVNVAGGAVFATRESLVFRKSGAPDRTIANVPAEPKPSPGQPVVDCGPDGIRLNGVFDNNYLLYSIDDTVLLYGVEEDRAAVLPIPPYSSMVWH